MSEDQTVEVVEALEVPDELTSLKQRADLLGLSYHPAIGLAKLRAKVLAALEDPVEEEVEEKVADFDATPFAESEHVRNNRLRQEAMELVRIRISCMNPNKKEWEGEIFSVGNGLIGTQKKFVPFNNEEGWHVPRCIYNMIVSRECQVFVSLRDARGNAIRKSKIIKEFAVEVLPNLTTDELQELARRQAMAKSID
jgi:hypothetical protein